MSAGLSVSPPPFPRLLTVIPAKAGIQMVADAAGMPAAPPPIVDRHSRESGNPQTNNVILAKAGTSQPREIKRESQSTDPFSLYGRRLG